MGKSGRVVEGAALEKPYGAKSFIVGSNPTSSAKNSEFGDSKSKTV